MSQNSYDNAIVATHEETGSSASIVSSESETPATVNGISVDSISAWRIVLASFGVQFISGGVFFCFGIFFVEISNEFEASGKEGVAWIASIMIATQHVVGPLVSILVNKLGCRIVSIIGSAAVAIGYGASYFAQDAATLYATLGIVSGIGFGLMYLPSMVIVPHYFEKRRALAVGVAVCGTGLGTLAFERIYDLMLDRFTWRESFAITGGLILLTIFFSILYGGQPKTLTSGEGQTCDTEKGPDKGSSPQCGKCVRGLIDLSVLKDPSFLLFAFCAMLSSIGTNIPHTFLPEIEKDLNSPSTVLGIISVTNIISRILLGYLSDQGFVNRLYLYNTILIIAGLGTIASPHFTGVWWVRVYAGFYGFCTGSYKSLKTVILVDMVGLQRLTAAYGLFSLLQTVGYVAGPPIVGKLYDDYGTYKEGFYFTGITFVVSGVLLFAVPITKKCSHCETTVQ